jgi:anaerobic magnesium-protoporphyrin IX monomethyl ester cyclase
MLSVLDIFINHSYMASQMKDAMKDGKGMPEEVKELMRADKGHAKGQQLDRHPTIAPIP